MFEVGEKVYHMNLGKVGIFDGYDDLDTDTCRVRFEDEYGKYTDSKRVSINQLFLDEFIIKLEV